VARAIFGILDPDTFGLGELDLRLDAGIRLAGRLTRAWRCVA